MGVWCVCFLLAGWLPAFQSHVVARSDARERANSPRSSARRSCFGRTLPLLWISIRKGTGPTDSTYPSRGRQLDGVFGNPVLGQRNLFVTKYCTTAGHMEPLPKARVHAEALGAAAIPQACRPNSNAIRPQRPWLGLPARPSTPRSSARSFVLCFQTTEFGTPCDGQP